MSPKTLQKDGGTVPALRRGLRMLEAVARAERRVGFEDLLAREGVPRATAARLLGALREGRYVVREADGYRLGPRLAELLAAGARRERFRDLARPLLKGLSERTGNTAVAFYWDGRETEMAAKEMHPAAVVMQPVGNRVRLELRTPWGLLLLSSLPPAEQARVAAGAKRRREGAWLKRRQRYAAEHGFAYDDGESLPGVRRLAAAVRAGGGVVGCLALGGTPYTMPDRRVASFGKQLRLAADELSRALA